MPSENLNSKNRLYLLYIFLLALVLRIYHLGYKSVWYDEAVSFFLAQEGYRSLKLIGLETAQPLYNLLLFPFITLFGKSEYSLRSLSLLLGILSIYTGYKLFTISSEKKLALSLSFLLALSPFHIWYSQEARAYTLFLFLSLACMYYWWKFILEGENKNLIFFGLCLLLNLYTHYYAILVTVSLYSYLIFIIKKLKKSSFWKLLLVLFLIFLMFLPYIFSASIKQINYPTWQYSPLRMKSLYRLTEDFNPFAPLSKHSGIFLFLNLTMLILFLKGFIQELRERTGSFSFFCAYFTLSYLCLSALISFYKNLYHPRFMIPVLPFYLYFISVALFKNQRIKNISVIISLFFIIYLFSFLEFENWHKKNDWRQTADFIQKHTPDENYTLILKPYWTLIPLLYYLPQAKDKIIEKFTPDSITDSPLWLILSYNQQKNLLLIDKTIRALETREYNEKLMHSTSGITIYEFIKK